VKYRFHISVTTTILLLALSASLCAQRVDPKNTHFRAWTVDRVITEAKTGARKPAHADMPGILGFVVIYHPRNPDLCLVEYVTRKHSDLDPLRQVAAAATDAQFKLFERANSKGADFAAAAKAAGFPDVDLEKFAVRVP